MKKKYRLKNKRRFISFIALAVITVFTAVYTSTVYGYKEAAYQTVVVRPGDTLWGIASDYNTGRDIREYIYKVKKLNSLSDSVIYAGTEIRLP